MAYLKGAPEEMYASTSKNQFHAYAATRRKGLPERKDPPERKDEAWKCATGLRSSTEPGASADAGADGHDRHGERRVMIAQ